MHEEVLIVCVCVCVFLQAAEMMEDQVDSDSHSWGGSRGIRTCPVSLDASSLSRTPIRLVWLARLDLFMLTPT